MTPEMAFDCLLVSRDTDALSVMIPLLDGLSIHTSICMTPSRAAELLPQRSVDLVVLDWDGDDANRQLLQSIWNRRSRWKTTIVAMSGQACIPGIHFTLKKPVTKELGIKVLRLAYSRMVRDFRRVARYAVMSSVWATDEHSRSVPITVLDVGPEGVGLRTKGQLNVGAVLTFDLALPNARKSIHVEARVLWTREHGTAGCEFLRIPPVDLEVLRTWLLDKCKFKKFTTGVRSSVHRLEVEPSAGHSR